MERRGNNSYWLGRTLLVMVGVLTMFVLYMVLLPIIAYFSAGISLQESINYLARNGYAAYADPSGDLNVPNDLIVAGNIQGATGRTATLVIAAYNSSDIGKAQADYLCDYGNDQVQIQQAVSALPATGGEIKLLAGDYSVNVAGTYAFPEIGTLGYMVMYDKENVSITGERGAKVYVDGDQGMGFLTFASVYLNNSSISNIYIDNAKTHNSNANEAVWFYSCNTSTVKDMFVYDASIPIVIGFCEDWIMTDCWVSYCQVGGFDIDGSNNGFGANLRAMNCGNGLGLYRANNNTIYNVNITGSTMYLMTYMAAIQIRIEPCIGNKISGGFVSDSYGKALYISEIAHDTVISNMTFERSSLQTDNTYPHVFCVADNCTFTNNLFRKGTGNQAKYCIESDINSSGMVIKNNDFRAGAKTGVFYMNGATGYDIQFNKGYATEYYGTAVILNGEQAVSVTHGLADTPTIVTATGRHTETMDLFCGVRTSNAFVITASANVTGDRTIDIVALVR